MLDALKQLGPTAVITAAVFGLRGVISPSASSRLLYASDGMH